MELRLHGKDLIPQSEICLSHNRNPMGKKIDFSGIDNIMKRLRKLIDFAAAHENEKIDLSKVNIFTEGPYLHKDVTEEGRIVKTEAQSAEEERQNPKLFAKRRELAKQLREIIE